jgi:hypothetical protein
MGPAWSGTKELANVKIARLLAEGQFGHTLVLVFIRGEI